MLFDRVSCQSVRNLTPSLAPSAGSGAKHAGSFAGDARSYVALLLLAGDIVLRLGYCRGLCGGVEADSHDGCCKDSDAFHDDDGLSE